MQKVGDAYVKSEFKQHKNVTNKEQLDQFFSAWESYVAQIQHTARARDAMSAGALDDSGKDSSSHYKFGSNLPSHIDLSEEQKTQLKKLQGEASKLSSPSVEK